MFAHSVKNPEIKHYFLRRNSRWGNRHKEYRRWSYLCISASSTTPSKRTRDVAQVTCKNCLRELRRKGMVA